MNTDRSIDLLKAHMAQACQRLDTFVSTHGISLAALGVAMESFTRSVVSLPDGADCKAGCAFCCHLRVGVSIPEVLVIFNELTGQATSQGLDWFRSRVTALSGRGDVLDEDFFRQHQAACPFLDDGGRCLIYAIRPFACRAFHATDAEACKKGYDQRAEVKVPCYPLYRASTDVYTSAFIRVMADKGLHSFLVGFVSALEILFSDRTAPDRWLAGEDVFARARL